MPFIGSDIIVGFPGETEEDFEITCENVSRSGLTMAHVFPYSIRKDTLAAEMKNQVLKSDKISRASRLRAIVGEKYEQFLNRNINTVQEVIFEKRKLPEDGFYKGLTRNYLTVYAYSEEDVRNSIYNCIIDKRQQDKLFASIV